MFDHLRNGADKVTMGTNKRELRWISVPGSARAHVPSAPAPCNQGPIVSYARADVGEDLSHDATTHS